MFSPLRTQKFYRKKIRPKDIDFKNLTCSNTNVPGPKEKKKQKNLITK